MKTSLLSLFLLSTSFATFASTDTCKIKNLREVIVFTSGSISAFKSDFQGTVAAGGDVYLEDFYLDQTKCLSLTTAGQAGLAYGSVKNSMEGLKSVAIMNARVNGALRSNGDIYVSSANTDKAIGPKRPLTKNSNYFSFERRSITPTADFNDLNKQMIALSNQLASLPSNMEVKVSGNKVILTAKNKVNAVTLSTQSLPLLTENLIEIHAEENQQVTINFEGTLVALQGLGVELYGSVRPADINWNFKNAQSLFIKNTANAYYGIPGTVIAPNADVEFYEGLITGALYAKSIIYTDLSKGLKTGQINDGRPTDLPLE